MLSEIDNLNSGIAARLAELLVTHDMKQSELASRLKVDQSVVSSWLNGRRSIPHEKLLFICEIFDCPMAELTSFNCEIPIFGEVQTNYEIIDYDPLIDNKKLLIKNLFFPADCVGYIYGIDNKWSWRYRSIVIIRVVKGRWVDKKEMHPRSEGRLCLIQPAGGRKMLGVPHANAQGNWNISAMDGMGQIANDVDIHYAIPTLCAIPNWDILEKSFEPNLDN